VVSATGTAAATPAGAARSAAPQPSTGTRSPSASPASPRPQPGAPAAHLPAKAPENAGGGDGALVRHDRQRVRVAKKALPPVSEIHLPLLGWAVPLPSRDQIPLVVGVAAAAALEIIEWPIALVIIAGHTFAARGRNKSIHELADALEEAM